MTDEVVSVSVNGINFNVLATEYMDTSLVSCVYELCDFSLSLMIVVSELHEKAGMLHGDIKPHNLRWHSLLRQAYLIDFGHAQLAEGVRHCRATERFEAPEIRMQSMPHSRETDTYSVGESIVWACDDYRRRYRLSEGGLDSSRMKKLRVVGELLSAPLHDRMSLIQAIDELTTTLAAFKHEDDELISSRRKRPRSEDIGLSLQQHQAN